MLPRIGQEMGVRLSAGSLRRLARHLGYRWKRLRRSLKERRDAVLFGFFQQELAHLHRGERAGEVAVVYVDECRVSRQAPVPYAWQVRGQPAVRLPAERDSGGYSVLGFWQPGAADPARAFVGLVSETAWTAELFVKAVDEQVGTSGRPTVLVLDNASIHRATCVQQRLPAWRTAGVQLQSLPAYSPELNRIEILWRFLKHYWLTPPDYLSLDTLHQRLQFILKRIGYDYTITFA
ncbi:IS630 family transposase [Hymenobacter sp.]|uniref:IS630 family transposase n=1 Tax=Hymenobacter sp. TaxID=1898978 RepID=UPI00286C0668|nr:IS630 family transposase [Hymenobacter sp.]